MLWKEIGVGFLLAGFVAQIGNGAFNDLFLKGSPGVVAAIWGAFVGPLIAVLSFVCSVGNVPLAAVLWSGGISFAGAIAFIFADLLVLPILAIYRKYYGGAFALRITALMFVTMVARGAVDRRCLQRAGARSRRPAAEPHRRVRLDRPRLQARARPRRRCSRSPRCSR